MSDLYQSFLTTVQSKNLDDLDSFEDELFWTQLSLKEKKMLAFLILEKTDKELKETNSEEFLEKKVTLVEKLIICPEVFCQIASLNFKFAFENATQKHFLQALDKMMHAEEIDPEFVKSSAKWLHLWGNILVGVSRVVEDESFLEKALTKFSEAEENLSDDEPLRMELYWNMGLAWAQLGRYSGEVSDFQKSLETLEKVASPGCDCVDFKIDYGQTLVDYGCLKGNCEILTQGMDFFKVILSNSTHSLNPNQKSTITHSQDFQRSSCRKTAVDASYKRTWVCYALASASLYYLTQDPECLKAADQIFTEAIIYTTSPLLWLNWGKLFLYAGWMENSPQHLEAGLEKLTSSKIKECDPLQVCAHLGEGLILLGSHLEDPKLMLDGKERIKAGLEIAPKHPELSFSLSLAHLYFGIYFSEKKELLKAADFFENNFLKNSFNSENLYGLYLAKLHLGLLAKNEKYLEEARLIISRLSSLYPESSIYLNEKGICLLRMQEKEEFENPQEYLEEAIFCFKEACRLNETESTLLNLGCALDLLGECTGEEKDYEEAVDVLNKLFNINPTLLLARYHLGLSLSHLGELTADVESLCKAVELFESIVETHPENDELFCEYGYALLNLSELLFDPNHPENDMQLKQEAEEKLIRAAELGSSEACYHLACLYSLSKLTALAIQFLEKAEKLNALPASEDLQHDEWLANLRDTEQFKEFLVMRE